MSALPLERLAKIVMGLARDVDDHRQTCGDWVQLIALNPADLEALCIVEVWGVPVVGWDGVRPGHFKLLCDGQGFVIPAVDTFDELQDQWKYALPRPERLEAA